ncbi:MAG TPA: DUF2298 domain-containing protein, partial [Anaerolineales bacterium]|nr:DUF2298 domain-containing protein [Anaerolineales bacterium]
PYAFNGPGFFGLTFNQRWLDIIREVTDQVAGKADYPPNTHWADRSQLTFAWIQNAGWGMGLPLGIVATLGWLWAARRAWRDASFDRDSNREWQGHLLLVVWVGAYFLWQNAQFWRYMRYFMPIYPFAALLAAWALIELFDRAMALKTRTLREVRQTTLLRLGAIGLVAAVALATYAYAWAFTRIYTRPHTRVEASWWMLENIPGPLNVNFTTADGKVKTQPVAVPYDLVLKPGEGVWRAPFEPVTAGVVSEIASFHLYAPDTEVQIKITRDSEGADIAAEGRAIFPASPDTSEHPATVLLNGPVTLAASQPYYLHYTVRGSGGFVGESLSLNNDRETTFTLGGEINATGIDEVKGVIAFTPDTEVALDRLNIGSAQITFLESASTVRLSFSRDSEGNDKLAVSEIAVNLLEAASPKSFTFEPVSLETGQSYFITLEVLSGSPIRPAGAVLALESSWDDSLPLRLGGYDPFGGIYRMTNLELYERDIAIKRDRIVDTLSRSDYLVISSNREYDAMPRLPLRYPLTLKYYQSLFGCEEQLIIHCAYPAEVGLKGPLGYELVKVVESNPTLGAFDFSDQSADEAFTVYDHPKVMIFKRTLDYSPEGLLETLNTVDLTQVLEQSPIQYTAMPTALKLSPDRLAAQTEGGTWSELFDRNSLLNYYPTYGVVAWYLLIVFIGLTAWPIVFVVMRGLPDRGYPIAKLIGLLIITWVAWFTGSYKLLPFTSPILWFCLTLLLFLSGFVAFRNLAALGAFIKEKRNYILFVEAITFALFLYFLWVRWLNPDLWHPWLGGEKPADYSFFQSAIRSVYFPPYDAWFSGHYVNYYYYGYVVAAVPTKMLGIVPSIAYNLALPTLFAFAGIGAFCVAYNLVAADAKKSESAKTSEGDESLNPAEVATSAPASTPGYRLPIVAGVAAMVMMMLLGNLYQIRQLWRFLPEVADPPAPYSEEWIENALNAASGAARVLSGETQLPGDKGRWYFGASRAILNDPGLPTHRDAPITEFPYFSFLYADLHPHLSSMSIMLAALAWMVNVAFAAQSPASTPSAP